MASAMIPYVDEIIDELVDGLTISSACTKVGVSSKAFLSYINRGGSELRSRYAQAIEARADMLADQTIDIADNNEIDPARARNQILARQWNASKQAPKKYGERIDLNVTQSLDIRAILADARGRLRPMCDPLPMIDGEVVESNVLTAGSDTDNESVIDIFS